MGPEMGVGTKGLNPDARIHQEQMERRRVPAVGISRRKGSFCFRTGGVRIQVRMHVEPSTYPKWGHLFCCTLGHSPMTAHCDRQVDTP